MYKNINPLINKHFGLCAVEHHEDHSVGYDYVVDCVIGHELLFSIPDKFEVTEIDLAEAIDGTSQEYRKVLKAHFAASGLNLEEIARRS
ncbi:MULTISPECIES: hypothetical protein [unclassified Mesorhizobium]|uniref:hypothetical protein n=1 Tax=unclassified Mesorhizobium TaxID=325217 RepID=UPI003336B48A